MKAGDAPPGISEAGSERPVVRLIRREEEPRWNDLMATHHYLGFRRLVGESLKYVAEQDGEWSALLGWHAAAFNCGSRDRWIGWASEQQRWRRLRYVANNARFLILPGRGHHNLASQVLGANLRQLSRDWTAVFNHPVVLAETFVDERFRGTCYLAAGWVKLGETLGYRRNGGRYYFHGQQRSVWVKALDVRARELLSAPFDPPAFQPGGDVFDLNIVLDPEGGLLRRLAALPDARKRRGIRHSQVAVLMVAASACLSGARSFVAIGEWASELSQEALKRLGCRFHPVRRCYLPPSEPTLRRTLQTVDVDLMDKEIGAWLNERTKVAAVAVDGKTLRGSRGADGRGIHLMSVLVHKEGVVLGQRDVSHKTNEITQMKPLLDPLDLRGKVVTADALHTQIETARYLVEDKQADYVFTVKENQPQLLQDIAALDRGSFSPSGGNRGQGARSA